jgi:hypothetical protein
MTAGPPDTNLSVIVAVYDCPPINANCVYWMEQMKIYHCILLLLFTCSAVNADDLHLIVSGKSVHLNSDTSFNEKNWGLGFEYDFEERNKWIPFITGLAFKDSLKNTSKYLGGGTKRRFLLGDDPEGMHIDAGVFAFVMTRQDYKNNDPFVGALPFISVGNSRFSVNATYVPKIDPKMIAFVYFQATIKVAEF